MIRDIEDYGKMITYYSHGGGNLNLKTRALSIYYSTIMAPSIGSRSFALALVDLIGSVVNLSSKQATNGIHHLGEAFAKPFTLLALGVLGMASPSASVKTAQKIVSLLKCRSYIDPKQPTLIYQGWKRRVMFPIFGILGLHSVITGLAKILTSPISKKPDKTIIMGRDEVVKGIKSPFRGIYGIFKPS